MAPRAAWKALGLQPTGDRRAIKRAYAAKLKAIDPDRDVATFIKLREALASAEAAAVGIAAREASAVEGADGGDAQKVTTAVREESNLIHFGSQNAGTVVSFRGYEADEREADPREDWTWEQEDVVVRTTDASDPRNAVADALFRRGDAPASPWGLTGAVTALLSDDRMANVDFAADTEEWLAYVLAQSDEAADSVIPMVARHFGWGVELGLVRRRFYVAHVAQRADDLNCIAVLSNPAHQWHAAFTRLREPAPAKISLTDRMELARPIAEMLSSIRYHHPAVERTLDADHVAMWANAAGHADFRGPAPGFEGVSWFGWLVIIWLALAGLRLLAALSVAP